MRCWHKRKIGSPACTVSKRMTATVKPYRNDSVSLFVATLLLSLLLHPHEACRAQTPASGAPSPVSLVEEVARVQIAMLSRDGWYLRYRTHRVDDKNDVVRDVIETPDGNVARLILRDGHSLSREEDTAERSRLKGISKSSLQKKKKQESSGQSLAVDLIGAMPKAMLYSYAPGQPQSRSGAHDEIVLDYKPNPAFHPTSTPQEGLTGLEGRMWIDGKDHHLIRMDGHIIRNVNLAWGLVARIYPGGTIQMTQAKIGEGRFVYESLLMDLTIRELLVRTVHMKSMMRAENFQALPHTLSSDEAIRTLLDTPLP